MCIYCLITCKCTGQIYYIRRIFVLLEHLVAIYVSPSGVGITLVYHDVWDVCPYLSYNIHNFSK